MYKKRSLLLDLLEEKIKQIIKTKALLLIHLAGERTPIISAPVGFMSLDFSVKMCLLNSIVLTSSGLNIE